MGSVNIVFFLLWAGRGSSCILADRRDDDLVDRDALQIGELLTKRVAFSRDPADDAVCRFQLLHDHLQLAIEGPQSGILTCFPYCGYGRLLLLLCSLQGTNATLEVLA